MQITTMLGHQLEVDHNAIKLITGPTKRQKNPCTRVVGVSRGAINVEVEAEAFIKTLPNHANFVKLKFAQGSNFWANAALITNLRPAIPADLVVRPLAQAVIKFGTMVRFIATDHVTAKTLINAAGGKV